MKIGILGGGIIGLTTGVVLSEAGHDVHVMTREPIEAVTSYAAGATNYPFGCEESPRVLDWVDENVRVLAGLLDVPAAGVFQTRWKKLSEQSSCDRPYWLERMQDGRILGADEIPAPYRSGIGASLYVMAVDVYVAYMRARFADAGGVYEIAEVASPGAIAADYDALVNATGIYARDYVGDEALYPARGQSVIVRNPGVKGHTALFDKKFYLYPRGDQVLIGGSFDVGEWDRTPDAALTAEILAWAGEFEPLLRNPEILDVRVGLRPMRETVRLEREDLPCGTPLIHNYGHGGAGYTLSWGCASEVLKMIETL